MKAFIFDTETTGLIRYYNPSHTEPEQVKHYPQIIEFFGHLVEDTTGEVLGEVEFFAKNIRPLEPIITKITGINDAMLTDAPVFAENAEKVLALMERADVIVAHNLSFDLRMTRVDMIRSGLYQRFADIANAKKRLCTVEQTVHIKGHRLKLTDLHIYLFGEAFPEAHRARNDVNALTRCYLELRKRELI